MVVRLRKGQLRYFRSKALKSPNELYAMLVGRVLSTTKVEIERFVYPKLIVSTPGAVEPDEQAVEEVCEDAKSEGLMVVGSIHSHPNYLPVMSPTDYESHVISGDRISGIVEVTNGRTRVAFWSANSPLPCKLEFI